MRTDEEISFKKRKKAMYKLIQCKQISLVETTLKQTINLSHWFFR